MSISRQDQRDLVAGRVLVGAAVLGAVWFLARSPKARRLVWRGARYAALSWLPAYLAGQVRSAWAASAPETHQAIVERPVPAAAPVVTAFDPPSTAAPARSERPD
jgi:hypothetical protein